MTTKRSRPPNNGGDGDNGSKTSEQLRDQTAQTREELAETVEALTSKADVKTKPRQKAGEAATKISERAGPTVQTARARAAEMAGRARSKSGEVTAKAHQAASAKDTGQMARRRASMAVLIAVSAVAVLLVRRTRKRSRR